jgi:hypothetical protein
MIKANKYILNNTIDDIIEFIMAHKQSEILKSEIAIFELSKGQDCYVILSANDKLNKVIENQKECVDMTNSNDVVCHIIKDNRQYPCVFGREELRIFMEDYKSPITPSQGK